MTILNNQRDLMLVFHDTTGHDVTDHVMAKVNHKRVPYVEKQAACVLTKSNRRGLVQVSYQGNTSYFKVDRSRNNAFYIRWGKKIRGTFPINHLLSPVFYVKDNVKRLIRSGYVYPPGIYRRVQKIFTHTTSYTGFMVFNKPIYKPADTVKLKAFLMNRKGKPVRFEELQVKLFTYTNGYRKFLMGRAPAYRKGAYTYEFVLHDSLSIPLDSRINVSLCRNNGKQIKQDGFKYEAYELNNNTYALRGEVPRPHEPGVLYLRGTDTNDLPLYDVRAEMMITDVTPTAYFADHLFIPDTLWHHTQKLEPLGETKVAIPDSIFPPVAMDYTVQVAFLNTENERVEKSVTLHYTPRPFPAILTVEKDLVKVAPLPGITVKEDEFILKAVYEDQVLYDTSVTIPFEMPLLPSATSYALQYGKQSKIYEVETFADGVAPSAWRTKDSLFVDVSNTRNLLLRYQLFKHNHLVLKDTGRVIKIRRRIQTHADYSIAVQYIWAGKQVAGNYTIPYEQSTLAMTVHHLDVVYPGQEASFTIDVKDVEGKPVPGADVTAWAVTKKFASSSMPVAPSFKTPFHGRKAYNTFHEVKLPVEDTRYFQDAYWRNTLGLDSITYYQFLYPSNGYEWLSPDFNAAPWDLERRDGYWKQLESKAKYIFKDESTAFFTDTTGQLKFLNHNNRKEHTLEVLFVLDLDDQDQYAIQAPDKEEYGPFTAGYHEVVAIYDDASYIRVDSVLIQPYGLNVYDLKDYMICAADSFSRSVVETARKWSAEKYYSTYGRRKDLMLLRAAQYTITATDNPYSTEVCGRVTDSEGTGIPGVKLVVRGTSYGTVTDIDGNYHLGVPTSAVLVFSFIGYVTSDVPCAAGDVVDVSMKEDISALEEVVVVGYGMVAQKSNLTASISTTGVLEGRVAGLRLSHINAGYFSVGDANLQIRGENSIRDKDSTPLVLVDGVPMRMEDVEPNMITAMEVIKNDEATAIYGSRAANGVILISTKVGITSSELRSSGDVLLSASYSMPAIPSLADGLSGKSLRNNFRDYAFWQPALKTDASGQVTFNATFPDDVTGWELYTVGITDHKQTGQQQSAMHSFLPLVTQLALPRFMIAGDCTLAIAKVTNYTPDSLDLIRTLQVNDKMIYERRDTVMSSRIDSVMITAATTDSLTATYQLTFGDYKDGERRQIPVFPKGTLEAMGTFVAMPGDTTLNLSFDTAAGPVKLHAQADVMDVLSDEVAYLRNYPHACNEQLASKLQGLLVEKQLCEVRKEKFKNEHAISEIIRKLVKNQRKDGTWGWWGTGQTNLEMTLHIARTLNQAEELGYVAPYNRMELKTFLRGHLPEDAGAKRIQCLIFLAEQGEPVQAEIEAKVVMQKPHATLQERLLAQKLRVVAGNKPDLDWSDAYKHETLKGNVYWSDAHKLLFDNDVISTLTMYQLRELYSEHDSLLVKIRNYFLEQRKYHWRNTYESACILKAILPALLRTNNHGGKPALVLAESLDCRIESFPFDTTFVSNGALTIRKTGIEPVYITAYQEVWNDRPDPVADVLMVSSSFVGKDSVLEAGKPVVLKVDITVKKDAEYLMIQVPIPAGCSYESKLQSYRNGETHREYYPQQTNIYASSLRQGHYSYEIELVPRFKGTYTLNPASIEWMYFPTIFGREEMKRVFVK